MNIATVSVPSASEREHLHSLSIVQVSIAPQCISGPLGVAVCAVHVRIQFMCLFAFTKEVKSIWYIYKPVHNTEKCIIKHL